MSHASPILCQKAAPPPQPAPAVVLLVEDRDAVRSVTREFLALMLPGSTVHEAGDGASALALARQHRPDLAILDIMLPDTTGLVLTRQILELLPDTRILLMSIMPQPENTNLAQEHGACAFIPKEQLFQKLPGLLRSLYPHLTLPRSSS